MLPMELSAEFILFMSIYEDYRYAMQNKTTILNLILAEAVRKRWSSVPSFGGRLEDADGVLCILCVFDAVGT